MTSDPQALNANQTIAPGDTISFGYAVGMSDKSPGGTVSVNNGQAEVHFSCSKQGGSSSSFTVMFPAPKDGIVIPARDAHWYPTGNADAYQGFEVSVSAPDVCGGRPVWVNSSGVVYRASLSSTDAADQVSIQFHGVDARSSGSQHNLNCGSQADNPKGGSACTGSWSHVATATPTKSSPPGAQSTTAPPQPSSSGQTGSSGSGSSGSGSGSGATPSPGPSGSGGGSGHGTTGSGAGAGGASATPSPAPGAGAHPTMGPLTVIVVGTPSGSSLAPRAGSPAPGHAAGASAVTPVVPTTTAPAPSNGPASPKSILGPVPVVVPTIGDVVSRASATLPWNWFLALVLVDGLLMGFILIRRRRAAPTA